jgi:hypothetical protein
MKEWVNGGLMQKYGYFLLGAILCVPVQSSAEIAIGGWVGLEYDGGTSGTSAHLRTNTLVSYTTGDFIAGIGIYNEWVQFSGGFAGNPVEPYILLGYGNVVASYGSIYGAGNLFPEDYFGMSDTTSVSDQVLRLDFNFGAHNFAISNDLNGASISEIELGYSGRFQEYDVAFGYEADSTELALLIGRDFGNWGVQVATVQDTGIAVGPWDHAGVSLFHDFTSGLTIGGNIAHGTNGTVGLLSYGLILNYDTGFALIKAEYVRDEVADSPDFELGFIIPFGKKQPSAGARFEMHEYLGRYVR